jgi:hypothetical protein
MAESLPGFNELSGCKAFRGGFGAESGIDENHYCITRQAA